MALSWSPAAACPSQPWLCAARFPPFPCPPASCGPGAHHTHYLSPPCHFPTRRHLLSHHSHTSCATISPTVTRAATIFYLHSSYVTIFSSYYVYTLEVHSYYLFRGRRQQPLRCTAVLLSEAALSSLASS